MVQIITRDKVTGKILRVQIKTEGKCLVKQSDEKRCNINNIVSKFLKHGVMPEGTQPKKYGDFDQHIDYETQLNKITDIQSYFEDLSSEVRNGFKNNVKNMLDFVSNPENKDKAIKMGIVERPENWVDPEVIKARELADKKAAEALQAAKDLVERAKPVKGAAVASSDAKDS